MRTLMPEIEVVTDFGRRCRWGGTGKSLDRFATAPMTRR